MQRSKRALAVLVALAALVVLAVSIWSPTWFVASQRNDIARGEPLASGESSTLAAPERVLEHELGTARRSVVVDGAEQGTVDGGVVPADLASAAPRPVVLQLVVDDSWFTGPLNGALRRVDASGAVSIHKFQLMRVELPTAPRSVDEFTDIQTAIFDLHAVELRELEVPADANDQAPTFELEVALEQGPVVDWAPSVPLHERGLVAVVLGGSREPTRDANGRVARGSGPVRDHLDLPVTLPRMTIPNVVWVGAVGRQWRAFPMTTESRRIEVSLQRTATLIVLHEAKVGTSVLAERTHLGIAARAVVRDESPVVIENVPAGEYRVRFDDETTHAIRVVLVAGETTEIDLRAAAALEGRGGIRLAVRTAPELAELLKRPLTARLRRGAARDVEGPSHDIGELRRLTRNVDVTTFEASGLEPGPHNAILFPFGGSVDFDVVAGRFTDVELDLDGVGTVQFETPPGFDVGWATITLAGSRAGSGEPVNAPLPGQVSAKSLTYPTACGTYTATGTWHGAEGIFGLTSDPFVVTVGATTVVTLRVAPLASLSISAIDTRTAEPIALEPDFWDGVRASDRSGNLLPRVWTAFLGAPPAHTGVKWFVEPSEGLVRLVVPDHPFWTFEPIDAFELADGATITLRATAK